jgi:uncharacterized membrane protein
MFTAETTDSRSKPGGCVWFACVDYNRLCDCIVFSLFLYILFSFIDKAGGVAGDADNKVTAGHGVGQPAVIPPAVICFSSLILVYSFPISITYNQSSRLGCCA